MNDQKNIIEKIDEICPDGKKNRHSFFQLQYFIIGKEPTMQAKIQQCKCELQSRRDEIESISISLDDLFDKIRLQQISLKLIDDENKEVKEIKTRQIQRSIDSLEKQARQLTHVLRGKEDESNFLIGLYEKLIQVEPERDWDSLEVQAEYWNAKLTRDIESHLMLGQMPNVDEFRTVMALPSGMPIKDNTIKLINSRKQ